jgi:hypothetical protein
MKFYSTILVLCSISLFYTAASAQDYVVTTKGDTLRGSLKPVNYGPEKKVQITDLQKKKVSVSIFQTRFFVLKGETFRPVRRDNGYWFMKIVKDGYLSLYAFQMENQTSYEGRYLLKKDGTGLEVPNLGFKKIMTKYLAECSGVTELISNGTLGRQELTQIIDSFNTCIDDHTNKHQQIIAEEQEIKKEVSGWDNLEEKLKLHADFPDKKNALDMVAEIKNKIQRGEKIPNFLVEGLKDVIAETELKTDLDNALREKN